MVAGRSGIARVESFDPSRLKAQVAGEVKDFDASGVLDKKDMRRTDRYIQFGLVAARQAMDQAGLPARLEGEEAERTGVILGTGLGGVGTLVDGITTNALRGPDRISPFLIPMGIPNVGAGQIAINYGMVGPNFTTVSACATGGHAIGEAWETIRRNDADTMLAGGSEAGVYEPLDGRLRFDAGADRAGTTTRRAPRGRSTGPRRVRAGRGLPASLVLEELEHARARGVRDPRRDHRLRRDGRRLAHHAARARRDRRGPGGATGAGQGRPRAVGHRPRQRPRDVDARGRQVGAPGDQDDLRRARGAGSRSPPTSR